MQQIIYHHLIYDENSERRKYRQEAGHTLIYVRHIYMTNTADT